SPLFSDAERAIIRARLADRRRPHMIYWRALNRLQCASVEDFRQPPSAFVPWLLELTPQELSRERGRAKRETRQRLTLARAEADQIARRARDVQTMLAARRRRAFLDAELLDSKKE